MKLKVEDILKPGAVIEAKKIDFNDPKVIDKIEKCRKAQREVIKSLHWGQREYDAMRIVINI